jgi:translocator protein
LINPAGYAFSIWGLIYSLILVFVVYQALPGAWVTRNDDMIFNQIGLLFAANMIFNGAWLIVFLQNTVVWRVLGGVDIILLTATTVWIMMITTRNQNNVVEIIGLRCAFSIYGGWLTAATILNIAIVLKDFGLKDSSPNMIVSEEVWGCIMLWVAYLVYFLVVLIERNPMFGAVYVWVLIAIIVEQSDHTWIVVNSSLILLSHLVFLVTSTGYLWFQKT